jgi:nucleotide-binding universal stress UspA family protein
MGNVDLKKIMIATDGSNCSMQAAKRAIELARLSGGTVYAVFVISTAYLFPIDRDYMSPMGVTPYLDSMYQAMYDTLKKQGQQAVNYVIGLGKAKEINVEPVILEGHPADELIRYAEEEGIDIIVMGTLGKTGIDRLLLGSVAENLVRHSKVPVIIVGKKCESPLQ